MSETDENIVIDMSPKRLAITMWEFSWLVRRDGNEAEYADWDRVLDELALRGYNCIRMDAFPHLVARDADGNLIEEFTVLPQRKRFMWGNHKPVQVTPRSSMATFIRKAAERGICVGLSTWFNNDSLGRCYEVVTPADFARVWGETLEFLESEGLLEHVCWVDLCNEFPAGVWARGAYPEIFSTRWWNLSKMLGTWSPDARQSVQRYFDESIASLRERFPDLRFTYSFQSVGSRQLRDLDVSHFDLLEPHVWLSDSVPFSLSSGQVLALAELPWGVPLHARRARCLHPKKRNQWIDSLSRGMDFWADWSRDTGLPLYTSEAWGPINYKDISPDGSSGEWSWVQDICAEGVGLAVEKGWQGICTSNFCQPHFKGMWRDVAWHQEMTRLIRAGN